MKIWLRKLIALSCWPFAALCNLVSPGVRILMFHRVDQLPAYDQLTVSPARFRQQMLWLARHYRVVPLSQALDEIRRGKVQPRTAVITFDDGYYDNHQHALPVLRELGLPATVFVTTRFASGEAQHARYPEARRLHMDWNEVRQWLDVPGNEIGAHSRTHPYLSRLSPDNCEQEIAGCMQDFAHEGIPHNGIFCYPSGDVGAREAGLVRRSGYVAAVTVAPGANRSGTDCYWLRRTEITDQDDRMSFFLKLSGAFDAMHGVLHWRRRRQFVRAAQQAG
ncbi:MAG: polysaccharide deacetylase family protein [Alcanivoracaceae bacterium]|nr:polysaccharide deacetylase family protein [Alcanivoracaceae bacterium]